MNFNAKINPFNPTIRNNKLSYDQINNKDLHQPCQSLNVHDDKPLQCPQSIINKSWGGRSSLNRGYFGLMNHPIRGDKKEDQNAKDQLLEKISYRPYKPDHIKTLNQLKETPYIQHKKHSKTVLQTNNQPTSHTIKNEPKTAQVSPLNNKYKYQYYNTSLKPENRGDYDKRVKSYSLGPTLQIQSLKNVENIDGMVEAVKKINDLEKQGIYLSNQFQGERNHSESTFFLEMNKDPEFQSITQKTIPNVRTIRAIQNHQPKINPLQNKTHLNIQISELKQALLKGIQQNDRLKEEKENYEQKINLLISQKEQLNKKNQEDVNKVRLQLQVKIQKIKLDTQMGHQRIKIEFEEQAKKKHQEHQRFKLSTESIINKYRAEIQNLKESIESIKREKQSIESMKDDTIVGLKCQIKHLKQSQLKLSKELQELNIEKIEQKNKLKNLIEQKTIELLKVESKCESIEEQLKNKCQKHKLTIQEINEQKTEIIKYFQGKLQKKLSNEIRQNSSNTKSLTSSSRSQATPKNSKNGVFDSNQSKPLIMRDKEKLKIKIVSEQTQCLQSNKDQNNQDHKKRNSNIKREVIEELQKKEEIIKELQKQIQQYIKTIDIMKQKIEKQKQAQRIKQQGIYKTVYQYYEQILQIFNIQWRQGEYPPQQELMLSINMFTKRIEDLMDAINLLEQQLSKVTKQKTQIKIQHERILKKCQSIISSVELENDELIHRCNQTYKKLEIAEEYIINMQKILQQCNLECIKANISKIDLQMRLKSINDEKSGKLPQSQDIQKIDIGIQQQLIVQLPLQKASREQGQKNRKQNLPKEEDTKQIKQVQGNCSNEPADLFFAPLSPASNNTRFSSLNGVASFQLTFQSGELSRIEIQNDV